MNKLIAFPIDKFNELPAFLQEIILILSGIWLATKILSRILDEKAWKAIKKNLKLAGKSAKTIASGTVRAISQSLDDPIKYPRLEIAMTFVFCVNSYLGSILFFLFFIVLTLLFAYGHVKPGLGYHVSAFLFLLVLLFFVFYLKAEGGRTLVELRRKIDDYRNSKNNV